MLGNHFFALLSSRTSQAHSSCPRTGELLRRQLRKLVQVRLQILYCCRWLCAHADRRTQAHGGWFAFWSARLQLQHAV